MAGVVPALDYLAEASPAEPRPLTVVFGDEWLLRKLTLDAMRRVLYGEVTGDGGEEPVIPDETLDGEEVEWRDVRDEVSTISLFGQGKPRLVVVHAADNFISEYRDDIEKYAVSPSPRGILILVAKSFPGNTRLYKLVQKQHLAVDCRALEIVKGTRKFPDKQRIIAWLTSTAEARHRAKLPKQAADKLFELVGADLGCLDNEVEKLAILAGEGKTISAKLVEEHAASWREATTWDMIDSILDGDAPLAVERLGRILQAGAHPYALFGSVAWSLRRFAAAVRWIERAERAGERLELGAALAKSGVWERDKGERQLRQVGRARAGKLYHWLLELDLSLKGSHSQPERARWVLEQFIVRLSREFATAGRERS